MKATLILCFSFFVTVTFSQNLNDGLIVYYAFDGNVLDSSDNHFHGITNAEFTTDRLGNPNSALHFNGIDQYLNFPPKKQELKPPLPVSFSCWVLYEDPSPENAQLFTSDFDQNNYSGVWSSIDMQGRLTLSFGDNTENTGPSNRRTKHSTTLIEDSTWYFVIGIIKGPEDMDIFLNCTNDGGIYDGSGGDLEYTDFQGGLGRKDGHVYYPPYYMKGSIDEFRYWNRALTQEDIRLLCQDIPIE